jgi:hypothetical protein
MICKAFQYSNLIQFKRDMLKMFGSRAVSLEVIVSEIGCDKLKIAPSNHSAAGSK